MQDLEGERFFMSDLQLHDRLTRTLHDVLRMHGFPLQHDAKSDDCVDMYDQLRSDQRYFKRPRCIVEQNIFRFDSCMDECLLRDIDHLLNDIAVPL